MPARVTEWVRHRTLRSRLLAVVLGLLLLSCAAVGAGTAVALQRFLVDRLDQQLAGAGARYALALEHPDNDADNQLSGLPGQPQGTLGARLKRGQVTAVGLVPGGQHLAATAADRAVLATLDSPRGPVTVKLPDLGHYRVLVTAGRDGDLLVTGLPLHPVNETVEHLAVVEAAVFAVVVLAAGAAAWVLVRLSLRPLDQVAAAALRVSELPLESGAVSLPERVPDPAPGTEVGRVAEAVNHMLEHVEASLAQRHAAEERLRHFVADASHELRTPVAVVRGHADLARRSATDLPAPVAHSLDRIAAEAQRMGRLVEDLLLLARLDSGRPLAREEVDLTRLLLDAVGDAHVAGPDHRWQLDLPDEPVTVTGDPHALAQVVTNLLANARRHTPSGTTVTASIEADPRRPWVEVHVHDDGPGIAPDLVPELFERFTRGDVARSRAAGGSGLGLSIVKAIVTAHHGTVAVTSRPGDTDFVVRLPGGNSSGEAVDLRGSRSSER